MEVTVVVGSLGEYEAGRRTMDQCGMPGAGRAGGQPRAAKAVCRAGVSAAICSNRSPEEGGLSGWVSGARGVAA